MRDWFPIYLVNKAVGLNEIAPYNFIAVDTQTPELEMLRSRIFGTEPDTLFIKCRLCQLLSIVYNSDLLKIVLSEDDRLTWTNKNNVADLVNKSFEIVSHALNTIAGDIKVTGQHQANDSEGSTFIQWLIEIVDSETLKIITQQGYSTWTTLKTLTIPEEGLSTSILLPRSTVQLAVGGQATKKWLITASSRPRLDVWALWLLISPLITSDIETVLFGEEPTGNLLTLKNVWQLHWSFLYRFSAVLLAIALQTKEKANG